MSTTAQVIAITALVFGIVAVLFAAIYAWERWVTGTRFEQRLDGLFDRITEKLFNR
jgi:hypothetical protein